MKRKITALALSSVIAASGLSLVSAPASAEWVKSGSSYSYTEGGKKLTGWQEIDGGKYYFNKEGKALTGWYKIGGKTYYFNSAKKGRMVTGTVKIGSKTYTFGSDGVLRGETKSASKSGIPFGASKVTLKKSITSDGYVIVDESEGYIAFRKTGDERKYMYIFENGKMTAYVSSIDGNTADSLKKHFKNSGYESVVSYQDDQYDFNMVEKGDSLVFFGYYGNHDWTMTLYMSPELSREIKENDYTIDKISDIING